MFRTTVLSVILLSGSASAATFGLSINPSFSGGVGADLDILLREVADSPVGGRLTLGANLNDPYTFDPSAPSEQEVGVTVRGAFDLLYAVPTGTPGLSMDAYTGPRVAFFIGAFSDSTDFATTEAWLYGAGAGAMVRYELLSWLDVFVDGGLDVYARPTFNVVTSDGTTKRSPGQPGYDELDRLVNQPTLVPRLKLGLQLAF